MLIGLLIVSTLVFFKGIEADLLEPVKECVPTATVHGPNHVCVCSHEGVFHCRLRQHVDGSIADVKEKVKLPEIKYGDKCEYGKKYRMDCNTCHCGNQNNLLCTKAACLQPMEHEINKNEPEVEVDKRSNFQDAKPIKKKKKPRKIVRRENKPTKTDSPGFPSLPVDTICMPGRIYQEGCQRCFCLTDRTPACSYVNACKQAKAKRDLEAVDVRPQIKEKELNELPVLPHSASPCTPGTTYKVDCNACVCDEFQNLLCDKLLCISFNDMHRAEASKKSGLPCSSENFVENDVIHSKCVQCACNGTTYCKAKENCEADTEKILRSYGSSRSGSNLGFDYTAEKCVPEHIYKDSCNRCYCQADRTLRCTQKTCLNYHQSLLLEEQQKYLEEHGL